MIFLKSILSFIVHTPGMIGLKKSFTVAPGDGIFLLENVMVQDFVYSVHFRLPFLSFSNVCSKFQFLEENARIFVSLLLQSVIFN